MAGNKAFKEGCGFVPNKSGRFTAKEKVFIAHWAASGNKECAAYMAGYKNLKVSAWQKANNPLVAAEAKRIAMHRMQTEILPLAIERHAQLLNDPNTTGTMMKAALELAYKYSGLLGDQDLSQVAPEDMTPAQLAKAIETLKGARATVIDAEAVEISTASGPFPAPPDQDAD